ncbi:MAG TPA: hypothetical protein VK993_04610 [Chthoniobacterales bacterium]|nr:hypothetical protein [Chthoniobacterales bacterium]
MDSKPLTFFAEDPKRTAAAKLFGVRFECHLTTDLAANDEASALLHRFRKRCGEVEQAFDLAFISTVESPFGLFCLVHAHVADDRVSELSIRLGRKPPTEPPAAIAELDSAIGGFAQGWQRLMRVVAAQRASCDARLHVFVTKNFVPPFRLRRRRAFRNDVFKLETEELEFSCSHSKNLEIAATFKRGAPGTLLRIENTLDIEFTADFVEVISKRLFAECKPLFESNEPIKGTD